MSRNGPILARQSNATVSSPIHCRAAKDIGLPSTPFHSMPAWFKRTLEPVAAARAPSASALISPGRARLLGDWAMSLMG
jgi:hypothetical protein